MSTQFTSQSHIFRLLQNLQTNLFLSINNFCYKNNVYQPDDTLITYFTYFHSICLMPALYRKVYVHCILLRYSRNLPAAPKFGWNFFQTSTEVMESSGYSGLNTNRSLPNRLTAPAPTYGFQIHSRSYPSGLPFPTRGGAWHPRLSKPDAFPW